jgi:hypothetical protein
MVKCSRISHKPETAPTVNEFCFSLVTPTRVDVVLKIFKEIFETGHVKIRLDK